MQIWLVFLVLDVHLEVSYLHQQTLFGLLMACCQADLVTHLCLSYYIAISVQVYYGIKGCPLELVVDLIDPYYDVVRPVGLDLQKHEIVHLIETILALPGHQLHLQLQRSQPD